MKTLILALGNPLRGDDGVGAAVLEALRMKDLPDALLIDGGTAGLETVLILEESDRAIIIDAADMGEAPGVWRRFSPDEVRLEARDMHLRGTLHYAGLSEALALGAAMNMLPQEITIFGVQPQEIGWEIGLSPAVAAAVPAVCAAVEETLRLQQETQHDP